MTGPGVGVGGHELHSLTVFHVVPGVLLVGRVVALPESRGNARLLIGLHEVRWPTAEVVDLLRRVDTQSPRRLVSLSGEVGVADSLKGTPVSGCVPPAKWPLRVGGAGAPGGAARYASLAVSAPSIASSAYLDRGG